MDVSNRTNQDNQETIDDNNGEAAQDTVDVSSFTAPLGALPLPTFKPRKNNRVSVAYPTSTTISPAARLPDAYLTAEGLPLPIGGPPGREDPNGTRASLSTPTPPAPSPTGGMKLPPPPMKNAGTGPAPIPYTKGDFRTAAIDNHWNDPPTKIFEKNTKKDDGTAYDFGPMSETLDRIIKECSANVPAHQKRMFEDTTKRLQSLQEQMRAGTVKERVVAPLSEMIEALSSRSFTQCHAIHAKLMQTEFDSEGKWLLGFKRLIDLYSTAPAS
ncbi:protein transport protein S31 [Linnemannia zychae]|nr:protein transport protein S31 [Linnemannia zychae]